MAERSEYETAYSVYRMCAECLNILKGALMYCKAVVLNITILLDCGVKSNMGMDTRNGGKFA